MVNAITASLWGPDTGRTSRALDLALRAAITTGGRADRQVCTTDHAELAAYATPSNKAGQPPPHADGAFATADVAVVCDTALTNHATLCAALSLGPDTSPARLIAALYADAGEAGLNRLDGDYAFVLCDLKRETVIARRDPFGVRPLFWAWALDGGLVFASLPEVIVDAGAIVPHRDVDGVVDLIAGSSARRPQTLLKGLYRVPACTQMTFRARDAGSLPTPGVYQPTGPELERVPRDFDGWAAELRRLMDRAVARRIPAQGDLGSSMSSGLDSTSVTMLAERHLRDDQHIYASTYAASQEAADAYPGLMDETAIAEQVVAGSNRISWQRHRIPPFTQLPDIRPGLAIWASEIDSSPELVTPVAAAAQGADVMLTGWGGDNTISYKGKGTAAALLRKGQWRQLRYMCRSMGRTGRSAVRFYAGALAGWVIPYGTRLRELASGPKRQTLNYNHRMYTGLKPEFRAGSDLLDNRTSDTQANRLKEIMSPVLALRIEVLACHGLRHGLRYIHPLLDRELINYSLTCPPEFEFRNGLFRAPVRAAMEGVVHDAARLKGRTALPFVESGLRVMRLKDQLMAELDRLEADPRLKKWFDFDFVRQSMALQPSVEEAEAHVIKVSTSGEESQWPLNSSFAAITNMMALQAALDEAEAGEIPKDDNRLK